MLANFSRPLQTGTAAHDQDRHPYAGPRTGTTGAGVDGTQPVFTDDFGVEQVT